MIKNTLTYLFFVVLIAVSAQSLHAQKLSYPELKSNLDKHFYLNQWDSLEHHCSAAIDQGYDLYLVHYYLGASNFEQSNYFSAVHYLEKAKEQNIYALQDSTFAKYLYYSYINTLQNGAAEIVRKESGSKSLTKAIKPIRSFGFHIGTAPANVHADTLLTKKVVTDSLLPFPIQIPFYREIDYPSHQNYLSISIHSELAPKLQVWGSYANIQAHRDAYIAGPINKQLTPYVQKQYQGYMGLQYDINPKWSLYAGGSYFTYKSYNFAYESLDSLGFLNIINDSTVFKNYFTNLSIKRRYKNMKFGLNGSYAIINDHEVIQAGLCFVWFPFGNSDYYSVSNINYKLEENNNSLILHQQVGFKAGPLTWIEFDWRYGKLRNFGDQGGSNIYNIADDLNMIAGINVKQMIFNRIFFTTSFSLNWMTSYYGDIESPGDEIITKELDYKQYNIIGGLQWVF